MAMCLAIPAKIIRFINDKLILADFGGIEREVNLGILGETVAIGDYVLVHTGFAVAKIEEDEALETIAMFKEIESYNTSRE